MAIQNRRGTYSDFDPTKMVEGEFAVVQSGDPNTSDGKAVYISTQTGSVERLALYKDVTQAVSTAIDEVTEDVIEDINEGVAENVERAETAAENAESSAEEAAEILENKADIDGTYDNLVVGNLLSDTMQTDTAPYLFRPTGGGLQRIGERCYPVLVGASVAENQLVNIPDGTRTISGITTVRSDGVKISYSGTSTATVTYIDAYAYTNTDSFLTQFIAGHRYLIRAISSDNKLFTVVNNPYTDMISGDGRKRELIYTPSATPSYFHIRVLANNGEAVNGNGYLQVTDLTAYFGSSIADYIYSLEQAMAGSGIAWLRSYGFLKGYQAYNAGSLESVEVTGKVVKGFNQCDEEWEVGGINEGNGTNDTANDIIRSKNYIAVVPNTSYYCSYGNANKVYECFFYDADKGYLGYAITNNGLVTTPANCAFMRFRCRNAYGTTYKNDICINLSSDRNGEYEAYTSTSYALGTDTLRGLFKLDANNNLYADGDRKESDGTITRRYGVVDLGTLNWSRSGDSPEGGNLYLTSGLLASIGNLNFLCQKYSNSGVTNPRVIHNGLSGCSAGNKNFYIRDDSFTDATAFKNSLSGVYLVCEKATPTTETSTPFPSPQVCYPDGTEEYVTSNGVPVGHETKYLYDLKGLVEGLIDVPDVPSANGTYVLKATRTADGLTYNWSLVAE